MPSAVSRYSIFTSTGTVSGIRNPTAAAPRAPTAAMDWAPQYAKAMKTMKINAV